jgi:hypothetical protein
MPSCISALTCWYINYGIYILYPCGFSKHVVQGIDVRKRIVGEGRSEA